MPEHMSDEQKMAIISAFERLGETALVAEEQQVSYLQANRLRRRYRLSGLDMLLDRPNCRPGPKGILTDEMVKALLEHLRLYPTVYLEEQAYFVYNQFGV
ncbi:MAG: hypothetical protein M1829_001156 [Trizodia sp. TS-e1964]|nr:MAG: hypothetical protein M1829_001156 [Trizodia sp. TS-e1964]